MCETPALDWLLGRVSAIGLTGRTQPWEPWAAQLHSLLSWGKHKACFSSKTNDSQQSPRTWEECATPALVCFKLVPESFS